MSLEKKSISIECKLGASNYNLWNFQMKMLLIDQKCVDELAVTAAGCHPVRLLDDNPRASLCIITNCTQDIILSLMLYETANDMWDFLYKTYSGKNVGRTFTGIKKLALFRYSQGSLEDNFESHADGFC